MIHFSNRHQRIEEKKRKDAETERAMAEREAARIANAQAKARLAVLEHEVSGMRKRISEAEDRVAKERQAQELQKRQAVALKCYDVKMQELIAIQKEYTKRLHEITKDLSTYRERYLAVLWSCFT